MEGGTVKGGWRWLVWWSFLAVWTLALLTPHPVAVSRAVLPEESRFPAAKTLHVASYALLAAGAFVPGGWRRWAPVILLSLHGFATEYLQNFVEDRTGSWADVGIDHAGIALGLAVAWVGRMAVRGAKRATVSGA